MLVPFTTPSAGVIKRPPAPTAIPSTQLGRVRSGVRTEWALADWRGKHLAGKGACLLDTPVDVLPLRAWRPHDEKGTHIMSTPWWTG